MNNQAEPAGAKAATQQDWPGLQMLRRNLGAMQDPLPDSAKRLLQQHNRLHELDAQPEVLKLQGLDQSDALNQSVRVFPFNEDSLVDELTKPLASVAPGKIGSVDGKKTNPVRSRTAQADKAVDAKSSTLQNAQADVKKIASLSRQDDQAQVKVSNRAGGHTLTPDFMLQWIDQILSANASYAPAQSKSDQLSPGRQSADPGLSDSGTRSGLGHLDSARQYAGKSRDLPGQQKTTYQNRLPGEHLPHITQPAPDHAGPTRSLASAQVNSNQLIAQKGAAQTVRHHSPASLTSSTAKPDPTKPDPEPNPPGITLLSQLTQQLAQQPLLVQKNTVPGEIGSIPARLKTMPGTATQNPPPAPDHDLINNTAWRELEKNLHRDLSDQKKGRYQRMVPDRNIPHVQPAPDHAGPTRSLASAQANSNQLIAQKDATQTVRHHSPASLTSSTAKPDPTKPDPEPNPPGITLLSQLTQQLAQQPLLVQKNTVPGEIGSIPARLKTMPGTATQNPPPAPDHDLINNTAWRELERNLQGVQPAARPLAQNPAVSHPHSFVDPLDAGFDDSDEPERVAALVNEALVEQAMRHGVDLS